MDLTLVVGVGEVGGALAQVLERRYEVARLDLKLAEEIETPVEVMHICFPFASRAQFHSAVRGYIRRFQPGLTIINSTVPPHTTAELAAAIQTPIAYSPVRGKHARMVEELSHYTKFVSAPNPAHAEMAQYHFRGAGMTTALIERTESLELAKLAETTYFGVIIAFAQELNRYVQTAGADYDDVARFFEEIPFLPGQKYFPGFIGGHCVIPNIHLLRKFAPCGLLDAVLRSNEMRARELEGQQVAANGPSLGIRKYARPDSAG